MLEKSVVEKCWREKWGGEGCCREVLGKSVVEKCCREVSDRSVGEECCREVLEREGRWRRVSVVEKSNVGKCWREVLQQFAVAVELRLLCVGGYQLWIQKDATDTK